ncbi:DNA-processing protein DprA [Natranaerobius thermophilus JW/NM-WN-LF]
MIPGLGNNRIKKLIQWFGCGEEVWNSSIENLLEVSGISYDLAENIVVHRSKIDLQKKVNEIMEQGIKIILPEEYPESLQEIYDSPVLLYAKGDVSLLNTRKLAVVGTRKITSYGDIVIKNIIPSVTRADITIVSGLAKGTDAKAHYRCLQEGGKTIAVLGNGLDIIYPPENRELYKQISEKGLLISEYPPELGPQKFHFPQRNRIISGLSEGVLVIEAPKKSGAMITAQLALDQNREVFAIPGNINNPCSQGCNALIAQGAKVVTDPDDILTEYNLTVNMLIEESKNRLSSSQKAILEKIPYYEISIDELLSSTNTDKDIYTCLLELELNGWIMRRLGGYVIRIK